MSYLDHDVISNPITLETDASEKGFGASLYQTIGENKHYLKFISKAFNGPQINWSTIGKECYAIYFAIVKLEYLIRDLPFTVKTDHKNLIALENGTGKVLRWKLAIQEYDRTFKYVKGIENIIPDAFSRLCNITALTFAEIPQELITKLHAVHNDTVGHFGEEITVQ